MRHFLYNMISRSRAPAGIGTTAGWFAFYKWKIDGECFVPVREQKYVGAAKGVLPADTLWFAMDGKVIGSVPVLGVDEVPLEEGVEVRYLGSKCRDAKHGEGVQLPTLPNAAFIELDQGLVRALSRR